MCIFMCLCGYVYMHASAHEGQKGTLNPLEPRLHAVMNHLMWVLEPKLRSSARAPNC